VLVVQIVHVLGCGQLRIGHIEEVAMAGQLAEEFPGFHVRLVVGRVAARGTKVDRHAAVVTEREDVDQLLQIGAMVLVVAPGNGQGAPPGAGVFFGSIRVVAVEGDRGGVVVQLAERDLEFTDRLPDHGQHEGPLFAPKQAVQCPADGVVAQRFQLVQRQAQQVGRDEQVSQQHQQCFGRRDLHAFVLRRQVLLQQFLQAKPLNEVVEDRQGSDLFGAKGLSARTSLSASRLAFAGTVGTRGFSLAHRLLSISRSRRFVTSMRTLWSHHSMCVLHAGINCPVRAKVKSRQGTRRDLGKSPST
jgi:hypothetical protein